MRKSGYGSLSALLTMAATLFAGGGNATARRGRRGGEVDVGAFEAAMR